MFEGVATTNHFKWHLRGEQNGETTQRLALLTKRNVKNITITRETVRIKDKYNCRRQIDN